MENPVETITWCKMADTNILAVAGNNSTLTLFPIDEKNKLKTKTQISHPISAWARREFINVDTRIREATLKTLAQFPDKFSVSTIADQASEDIETKIRSLATALLADIDHDDVDEELAKLLKNSDKYKEWIA